METVTSMLANYLDVGILGGNSTGSGAMSVTTSISEKCQLVSVNLHLSAAPTTAENFQVKKDSVNGSAYDTVLFSIDPSASSATDIVWLPESEIRLQDGDELVFSYTNTDAGTWGLEYDIRKIGG